MSPNNPGLFLWISYSKYHSFASIFEHLSSLEVTLALVRLFYIRNTCLILCRTASIASSASFFRYRLLVILRYFLLFEQDFPDKSFEYT